MSGRTGTQPGLGYLFAFLSAMVSAAAFITAKPVLGYLDPLSFSVSQFGLAAVFSFGWLVYLRRVRSLAGITPRQWTLMLVVSMLFLGAIYTLWIGLSRIPATAASLLNRLEILVTVFLGMALLGDRLTRRDALGAAVMFLGVVVLRYQAPSSFDAGFWMVILSATLFGVIEIIIKSRIHDIPPAVFAFGRNAIVFVLFLVAALWRVAMDTDTWWKGLVDWEGIVRGWPLIAITALAGPFLARTLYMYCLKHLPITRASVIIQSTPFFVALYSALLLHTLPSRREWTGGLLIVAGAALLVSWSAGITWLRNRRQDASPPPGPPE